MSLRSAAVARPARASPRRLGLTFAAAGALVLLSVVAPAGLSALTDWAWAVGLVLVGLGVLAVAAGLFGLSRLVDDGAPGLAAAGAAGAGIAALAGLSLVAFAGVAAVGEAALGLSVPRPFRAFAVVVLATGGGLSLGLLSIGAAGLRTGAYPRSAAALLAAGGLVLLAPVALELAGPVGGFDTPRWVGVPAVALTALDALAVGLALRARGEGGGAGDG